MDTHIRALREEKELKLKDMAAYLPCDLSLYSKYERGKREIPLHIVVRLAQYFGTSIEYLIGLTDDKKPYPPSEEMSNE